jgi:branched-chain amino acid transport system ATP-binding protein
MLALGMALMTQPSILLLDEPCTGLAPIVVRDVLHGLRAINDKSGTTIVLVEQNVQAALREVERAIVVKTGRVILDGPSVELAGKEDLWNWF